MEKKLILGGKTSRATDRSPGTEKLMDLLLIDREL